MYPSHFRPVLVHLRQAGLASSHFTRRILGKVRVEMQATWGQLTCKFGSQISPWDRFFFFEADRETLRVDFTDSRAAG